MSRPKTRATPQRPDEPGHLPTGSFALDLALGGGWPRGRVAEVSGLSGSGKTTLLLHAVAEAQKAGGMGALIDADHAVTERTAARLGVDLDRMPYHRTNGLEDACERIEELAKGGAVSVIALDSVAALVPARYLESRDWDDAMPKDERHQFQIDSFLKCLLGPLADSGAVLLVSNQVREKVGVVYGNPETPPWATLPLRDFATVRVEMRKGAPIKLGEDFIGTELKAKVVKHRSDAPFRVAECDLYFATGFSPAHDLLTLGTQERVLDKRGTHFYFQGHNLGNGTQAAAETIRRDDALAARLRDAIVARRQA